MRTKGIIFGILATLLVVTGTIGVAIYRATGTFAIAIPTSSATDQPGTLVAVEQIGKYPRFAVQYLLNRANLPEPITVTNGIVLYRVQYRTTNFDGSAVVASGLVSLPDEHGLESVIIYHHGTIAERKAAPSQPSSEEGVLVAAAAAGNGHIFLAPDYIGLGESREAHPYFCTKTTVSTSIDFLRATRILVMQLRGSWPVSLYLMGFSQGGHATFAVQRELERLQDPQFKVRAAAPIAGPFYLREVSFPQALKCHAFYLAYLANAYSRIYGRPLKTILAAPFFEEVPLLFDGNHSTDEIVSALPHEPRRLFIPEFLDAYDHDRPHWFLDSLAANDVHDWTPIAPVRVYFGEDDVDVLPEEARRVEASMKQRGADITSISIGSYDHNGTALRAIPSAIRWFTALAKQQSDSK